MRIAPGILGCTWRHQPAPHSPSRCAAGQSSRSFWSGYIAAWWDIGRKIWGRCNTPGNRPGCWCGRTKPSIPGRSRSHNVHHRHTSTARAHPVSLWDACRRWTAPGHRQILFCRYEVFYRWSPPQQSQFPGKSLSLCHTWTLPGVPTASST